MSTIATMSVADLLEQRTLIDTQICIKTGGAVAGLTKSGKPKKESTRKGKPTCNGDFTKKICAEQKEAIEEFKKANPEKKGAHLSFLSNYKEEHKEEYEAFKTAWNEAHPKEDGSASDATGETKSDKPKRVLTPEHLAAMKAGREASKAKKAAEKDTFTATTIVVPALAAPAAPAAPAKKAVKKAQKAPVVVEPVAVIETAIEEEDGPEPLPFKHGGVTYMRIGTKRADGNHLWVTGDLWANKKGVKADYVGCLQDDGTVDTDALEPLLE